MVQRDPLGLTDIFQRDADRISRAFGNGAPQLPGIGNGAPRLPGLPIPTTNGQEPRTPPELLASIPNRITETAQTGLNLLVNAPQQIAEDLTVAVNNLLMAPAGLATEAFNTPAGLAQRLSPDNLGKVLETVRDSAEFRGASPQDMRARMRTITDVIDLFTPT